MNILEIKIKFDLIFQQYFSFNLENSTNTDSCTLSALK